MRRMRCVTVGLVVLVIGALGAGGVALADSAAPASAGAAQPGVRPGHLVVGVHVLRFSTHGRRVIAHGRLSARLTDNAGHTRVIHQRVALAAKTGGRCRVLHLNLDELNLQLLGLTAHLDRVTLDITGRRTGVLGRLFCRLAKAKISTVRASAARRLTVAVRRHRSRALRMSAVLQPQVAAAGATTCPVLDLVVGPLDLDLLGLVVDLNKVHLAVTATPGGGTLGDLFCSLST